MVGFPVVMKAVGPEFHHKTEAGLVVLGVQDEHAVRTTFCLTSGTRAGAGFEACWWRR